MYRKTKIGDVMEERPDLMDPDWVLEATEDDLYDLFGLGE